MNFERQKDGESWLFFERTKPRGRRRLALVRLDKETGTLGPVERLEASDEELERVKARVPSIRIPYRNKHLRTMRIAIVCEGETEAHYFAEFVARLGLSDRVDVTVSQFQDPGQAFEETGRRMLWNRTFGTPEHDEAWLVFDRDTHSGFNRAVGLAEKVPFVRTAFTNPCIEYWFLLHFKDFDGVLPWDQEVEIESRTEEAPLSERVVEVVKHIRVERLTSPELCTTTLQRYMPEYKKNGADVYKQLAPRMKQAWTRAREKTSPCQGHGSDLPLLIDRLCSMAGLTHPQAFEAAKKASGIAQGEFKSGATVPLKPPVPRTAMKYPPAVCRSAARSVIKAAGIGKRGRNEFRSSRIDCAKLLEDLGILESHFLACIPASRLPEVDDLTETSMYLQAVEMSYLECVLHSVKESGIGNFKQEKTAIKIVAALRCFAVWVRKL